MPLLNFQARFAELVQDGSKSQTIRAYRKDGRDPKPGDQLYLWAGCRTKDAQKIGEAICSRVIPIRIQECPKDRIDWGAVYMPNSSGTWRSLSRSHTRLIAVKDGFQSRKELFDFFRDVYGLPFEGLLIEWDFMSIPGGTCCSCGYAGQEETECPKREDRTHCVHWWDGE